MQEIKILGIDLAKTNFSICALSSEGRVVLRRSLSRAALIEFTAGLSPCVIGMEACGGSHHWGRLFERQGHRVKMMSVFAVKAFAPPQKKNDASDAEAIAVATAQSTVGSVRVKSVECQDLDILRNLREQMVKSRVALINQAHAVCLEFGVATPKSKTLKSWNRFFEALEDASNEMTEVARFVVEEILKQAQEFDDKALELEKKLEALARRQEGFELLKSIPGVGVMTAAAVLSHTGGRVEPFKNGRQFAAYLGLVPRQYSTGGRTTLRRITKSGHSEIRRLLVIGTRSTLVRASGKRDRVSLWASEKKKQKGFMRANVALANKTARIIYAVLKTQTPYKMT